MIDWHEKVVELKRMADELEMWASRADGRGRMGIGRIADELRAMVSQIEPLLEEPTEETQVADEPLPGWLQLADEAGDREE
jgi:hypothetical protein